MPQEATDPQEDGKHSPEDKPDHQSLPIQAYCARKCVRCIHVLFNLIHQDIAQEAFPWLSFLYVYPWAK